MYQFLSWKFIARIMVPSETKTKWQTHPKLQGGKKAREVVVGERPVVQINDCVALSKQLREGN